MNGVSGRRTRGTPACGSWPNKGAAVWPTFPSNSWARAAVWPKNSGSKFRPWLFGHDLAGEAPHLFAHGADQVYLVDDPALQNFSDDLYGDLLIGLIREHRPEIVLCGATVMGRSFFPKVASALNAGLTADCTGLDIREEDRLLLQTRPAFGGNIMATILCPSRRPQMSTVRPKVMKPLPKEEGRQGRLIQTPLPSGLAARTSVLEFMADLEDKTNLAEADVIVSGGRGPGSGQGLRSAAPPGRTHGRGGGRIPWGRGFRVDRLRSPSGPDRPHGFAQIVRRLRHLRGGPAPGGHAEFRRYRGSKQRSPRPDLRRGRLRFGRGFI